MAWYNSASATDPQKDIHLITSLGITIKRLNTIKRAFKQVIIKDGILYVLFRGQLKHADRWYPLTKILTRGYKALI